MRDVFICHASTDKRRYARPLERALGRRALSCWVDEGQLDVGDSLFAGINEGLATSRYVAALLTPAFLGRPWPEREIAAAFSRDITEGATVVLAILIAPAKDVFAAYPLLGDKVYLTWDSGLDEIADRIAHRFDRTPAADWHCNHPLNWIGQVWIRVNATAETVGAPHRLTVRWGPYIRKVELVAVGQDPVSLIHHKLDRDVVTLHVEVDPPAIITFGQGSPPEDAERLNIDEGWTRTAGWNFPQ